MARYHAGVRTHADISTTFAYLSRFDRAWEWDPGISDGALLTAAPVRRGSRFRLVARFIGRRVTLEYEVIEFDPPTRVVLQAETGAFRSTDTITFECSPSGTDVDYVAELQAKGWARPAAPLLDRAFRRVADRAAAGLGERLGSL